MRVLQIGSRTYTQVVCTDEPGAGGACHNYKIEPVMPISYDDDVLFGKVIFQNGPINEHGVNGCHQEDLLAIVIDRLQCFQKGEYACRENAIALTHIEEALMWLRKRTQDRIDRGVEGTSAK